MEEFKEMFKLVSGAELKVNKNQLKDSKWQNYRVFINLVLVYETMGIEQSEEEFEQKFAEIDENQVSLHIVANVLLFFQDGIVSYSELEEYF